MRISRKLIIIGVLCVVMLAGTLGGFAIINAADDDSTNTTQTALTTLMDQVAQVYEQNTGTAINPAELEKAFEEAGTAIRTEKMDQWLQSLVDDGKITQVQADEFKTWLNARPGIALTDEFKTWMESRPDIPGLFGGRGFGGMMPFGGRQGFGMMGNKIAQGFRGCLPDIDD